MPPTMPTASQISANDEDSGAKFTTVQGFIDLVLPEISLSPETYGAIGNGTADDRQAWADMMAAAASAGGGQVVCRAGATYLMTLAPVVPDNTSVNLNGCTINFSFPAGQDVTGFKPHNNTSIFNGKINVVPQGVPSGDTVAQCAIVFGERGANPPFGYNGCELHDLTITTNRSDSFGGGGIAIYSGSSNVDIRNITFPSSAHLGFGIRVTWAGDGGSPGIGVSAHPFNVSIDNVNFGTMTLPGSSDIAGIDIVAAYDVDVCNVHADQWTGSALVQVRPGAFGSAAAPQNVKNVFMQGISVRNITCSNAVNRILLINGFAHGGGSIPSATYSIPADIRNFKSFGPGAGSDPNVAAIELLFVSDVTLTNVECANHYRGLFLQQDVHRIRIESSRFYLNRDSGVVVANTTDNPTDITFENCRSYSNGQGSAGRAGYQLEACQRVNFIDCQAGADTTDTQWYGWDVASTAIDSKFSGRNSVANFAVGGEKYRFAGPIIGERQYSGGSSVPLSTVGDQWCPIMGVGSASGEDDSSVLSATALVLTNFQVLLTVAPGAGTSREIRVINSGAGTDLDVTISEADTIGSNYSTVEIDASTTLSVKAAITGTPASCRGKWSCEAFRG